MDISFLRKPIKGKKAILAFIGAILCGILLAKIAVNISNASYQKEQSTLKQNARFITKESYGVDGSSYNQLTVVEDKETKILYLMSNPNDSQQGLTPLLDKDGKPMKDVGDK